MTNFHGPFENTFLRLVSKGPSQTFPETNMTEAYLSAMGADEVIAGEKWGFSAEGHDIMLECKVH